MRRTLYRKYRPTKLTDVVGQEHITNVLAESIKSGKFSHAYLFTGPRGTGKTSVARIFAHEINGFKYEIEDDYLDIIEIDAASNRGIDNIRELREKVLIAPSVGKYKVYIIDEVHMLTREAFNALLKTLEEPPAHTIFIMATTNPEKVLTTITSRSQTFAFKLADPDTMTKHLQKIAQAEKINITDDALKIITRRGGGSFRDSLSLLDQISTLTDEQITPDIINHALGLPQDDMLRTLLDDYQNQDATTINQRLQEIFQYGSKPDTLASELIKLILTDPKPELLPLLDKLTNVTEPFAEAKLLLALIPFTRERSFGFSEDRKSPSEGATYIPDAPDRFARQDGSAGVPAYDVPAEEGLKSSPQSEDYCEEKNSPATASEDRCKRANSLAFNWQGFLDSFRSTHPAIYSQLTKAEYELTGNSLKIYHSSKIGRNILSKENNRTILLAKLDDFKLETLEILDPTTKPTTKNPALDQISAIMGTVQEVKHGGESPF